jgi:hypothetical protein
MKFLAWAGLILSGTIFGVVAFGYFSNSLDHFAEEEVEAPTDICWNYFTKVHRMDDWIEGFKKIEIIEGLPNKPGSTFRVTLERDGSENVLTQTVIAYEKGEIFSFDMENEIIFGHTEISFDRSNGKTIIKYRQILQGKNAIYHIGLKYNEARFVKQQNEDLHRLRKLIETEYQNSN